MKFNKLLSVILIILAGALLIYNLQLNGKITGFFVSDGTISSEKFVDSLTLSALENAEFDWTAGNACEGVSCSLSYVKISGKINAEKSGSVNIYLVDGDNRFKIFSKDFELETTTQEEIIPGEETTEEVCNTESQEVCTPQTQEFCHDETAEDGTINSICENQESQVCETQDVQVCENVTTPGQETRQNITTEVHEEYSFDDACDETCTPSGLDKTSYKISVELDEGITADINSISYQYLWEEAAVEDNDILIAEENDSGLLSNETLVNETLPEETGKFNWTTTILNNYGGESKEIN